MEPESMMNEAQTREVPKDIAGGYGSYASMAAMGPAVGGVTKALNTPLGGAALAGGSTLIATGDPQAALGVAASTYGGQKLLGKGIDWAGKKIAKSVMARVEHQLGQVAKVTPQIEAKVAQEVAPVVERAYRGIPGEMNIARSAPAVAQQPAAEAVKRAASIAEQAPPVARKLAPIPPGQSRIPSVLTKPPTQGPKMPNPAQEALKAKQLEAAKAAGVDLGEAFGGKSAPIAEKAVAKSADMAKPWMDPESLPKVALNEKLGNLTVRTADIPNYDSIASTFDDGAYKVLKGVRRMPIKAFNSEPHDLFYAANDIARTKALAAEIKANGYIKPLIVAYDDGEPYIVEGAHRLGALHLLGEKNIPALIVDARRAGSVAKAVSAAAPQAEQAAESALETRLRASVMLHKDKPALAAEIGTRVLEMRAAGGRGMTAEKISQAIEEQYGLPPTNVRQMVQMILREASR
jgi:hypothetical protein